MIFLQNIFNDSSFQELWNEQRKEFCAKKIAYYNDGQIDFLKEQLADHFQHPELLTPCFVNIVKKIINLKAQAYKEPPRRQIVNGTEKDQELLKLVSHESRLDLVMKTASRLLKLTKTLLIRPLWRNGRLDLDIITPDIADVEIGESPRDIVKIMITHYDQSGNADDTTYSVWTKQEVTHLDYRGELISTEPNPYGIIPFVPLWDYMPTGSDFFLEGADDLIAIQDAINEKLTELLYTIKMQGFGLGWIKNGDNNTNAVNEITVAPGSMIELHGKDSAIGFESQEAPIADIISAIDSLISWAAISNGISSSSISEKYLEESGVSRVVENKELDDLRRDDIEMFRIYEKHIFDVIKVIWNYHNKQKFSTFCSVILDFIDPVSLNNINELVSSYDSLIALGCASPIDLAMKMNPDLKTREQAKQYLDMIKAENEQYKETISLDDI